MSNVARSISLGTCSFLGEDMDEVARGRRHHVVQSNVIRIGHADAAVRGRAYQGVQSGRGTPVRSHGSVEVDSSLFELEYMELIRAEGVSAEPGLAVWGVGEGTVPCRDVVSFPVGGVKSAGWRMWPADHVRCEQLSRSGTASVLAPNAEGASPG